MGSSSSTRCKIVTATGYLVLYSGSRYCTRVSESLMRVIRVVRVVRVMRVMRVMREETVWYVDLQDIASRC